MAYKFQIGAAKMSGSLEQEGNVDIADSGVLKIEGTTVIDASRNFSPALLKMPDVTSGKILVADGTSYEEVTVSGDVTIASNGAVTIADDAVEQAMIADDAVGADQLASNAVVEGSIVDNAVTLAKMAALTRGSIILGDSSGDPSALAKGAANTFLQSDGTDLAYVAMSGDATLSAGALTIADDAVSLAKMAGLARGKFIVGDASGDPSALALGTSGQFLVSDNDDAIWRSLSGDATLGADGALTIANDAVEQAMIADDAVGADQLASNAVVNASVASGAAIAYSKMESVATGKVVVGNGLGVGTIVDISGDATLDGSGALTIADDAVSLAKMAGIARGKIIVGDSSGDPSALALGSAHQFFQSDGTDAAWVSMSGDVTLTAGVATIGANAVEGSMINSNAAGDGLAYSSNTLALDLNELTAAAVDVAADSIAIVDATDSSSKKESIADLVSAMAGAGLTATSGVLSTDGGSVTDWGLGATATLVEGFNYRSIAALSGNVALTLPGSTAPTVGDVVHVKAPASLGGFDLEINTYANQTVDGVQAIELESGGAAVSMVYITSGSWAIF